MAIHHLVRRLPVFVIALVCACFPAGCGSGDEGGGAVTENVKAAAPAIEPAAPAAAAAPTVKPAAVAPPATVPETVKAPITPRTVDQGATVGEKGGPIISFERRTHAFGEIWDVGAAETEFPFRNIGTDTLVISRVKPSCGCTAAQLEKREFAPGEGDVIKVAFSPKGFGRQSKTIDVFTNASEDPIRLAINADIKQFVRADPQVLRFGKVDLGREHVRRVTVSSPDPDIEVIGVSANARSGRTRDEYVTAKLLDDPPNTIEVTILDNAPWGPLYGSLSIEARGRFDENSETITHTTKVSVNAEVFGQLQAQPTMFRVGAVPPGQEFAATVELTRPSGDPFKLLSAEIVGSKISNIRVEVEPMPALGGAGYRLTLRGDPSNYLGPVSGTVNVKTDVEGEAAMSFAVGGIIRQPVKR